MLLRKKKQSQILTACSFYLGRGRTNGRYQEATRHLIGKNGKNHPKKKAKKKKSEALRTNLLNHYATKTSIHRKLVHNEWISIADMSYFQQPQFG